MAVWRGRVLERFVTWNGLKTTDSVKRIEALAREEGLRPRSQNAPAWGTIVVDAIGLGMGVADQLEDLRYHVERFEGGFKAGRRGKFINFRAESYWQFRGRLEEDRISLPRDETLFEELLSVRWKPSDTTDRIQLEPKEALKRRLGRSCDRADAATMAFFEKPTNSLRIGTFHF